MHDTVRVYTPLGFLLSPPHLMHLKVISPRQYACQCGPHRFRLVVTLTNSLHSLKFLYNVTNISAWRASVKQAYALMHQLTILTCPCHCNVILILVSNCHIWDTHVHIIVRIHIIIIYTINYRMCNGWFHNQFKDVTITNIWKLFTLVKLN
jgi:hypothetical protein